jgi:hypothetical protein
MSARIRTWLRSTQCVVLLAVFILSTAPGFACNGGQLSAAEKARKAAAAGFSSWGACVAAGACRVP